MQYLELCKPKVVALIVFTAIVGMFLAVPGMVPWPILISATVGIGLVAGAAAAMNHLLDRRIDAVMTRTQHRPLPSGQLNEKKVITFALLIGALGTGLLVWQVNVLTAVLTFLALLGYAIVYTVFLKRATPQNIVIGGAAGAAPPVLGWAAVTGEVHANALLLFLIIFAWTPPHFWALAIYRRHDYAQAAIPMLPVTHGVPFTRWQILFYTIILFLITLFPYLTGMSGLFYLGGAVVLGAAFLYYAIALLRRPDDELLPFKVFKFSILHLMALFAFLLIDHYLPR